MTTIRRIRVEAAPVVRELYRAATAELAERFPQDRIGISERGLSYLETLFRLGAVHEDEATFVAERDGEIVGFVGASVQRGRGLPGVAGEIDDGAKAIFHTDDVDRPEREPWESLGFEADVIRFSLYDG